MAIQRHRANHLGIKFDTTKPKPKTPKPKEVEAPEVEYEPEALYQNLGAQQQRFVDELVADPKMDVVRAAMRAGYGAASKQMGPRLLRGPRVAQAIVARLAEERDALNIKREQAMGLLGSLAFSTITDVVQWERREVVVNGKKHILLGSAELSPAAAGSIRSIELKPDGSFKITQRDNGGLIRLFVQGLTKGLGGGAQSRKVGVTTLDPKTGKEVPLGMPPPRRALTEEGDRDGD
jgi:Terminase small subunit